MLLLSRVVLVKYFDFHAKRQYPKDKSQPWMEKKILGDVRVLPEQAEMYLHDLFSAGFQN